jgi:hypothetical protein
MLVNRKTPRAAARRVALSSISADNTPRPTDRLQELPGAQDTHFFIDAVYEHWRDHRR